MATGKTVRDVTLSGGWPGAVAFSADGKVVAMAQAGTAGEIRSWRVADGEELLKLTGYRGAACSLIFTLDGKHLISGMDDASALVWELKP